MNTSVLLIKQLVFEEMQRRHPEDYDEGFIRSDANSLRVSFYLKLRGILYHVPITFEEMSNNGNFASANYLIERFEMLRRL